MSYPTFRPKSTCSQSLELSGMFVCVSVIKPASGACHAISPPYVHLSRVYTRTHVAGYKLYSLVAVNILVSATKLLPVCRPSVDRYKGIQVDRDINEK